MCEGTVNLVWEVTETCDDAITINEGASRHLQSVQGLVTSSVLFPCFWLLVKISFRMDGCLHATAVLPPSA